MSQSERDARLEKEATVNQKQVHQAKLFKLIQKEVSYNDQEVKTFDLIEHPGAVALIAIDEAMNLLFVKQWRHAVNCITIELPAGTLEQGESPIECAKRELREETGYHANAISSIGGFYVAPGISSEYIHLFFAEKLSYAPLVGDDTDSIDLLRIPMKEALEMVHKGEIIDAKTIAGILWYNQWLI